MADKTAQMMAERRLEAWTSPPIDPSLEAAPAVYIYRQRKWLLEKPVIN